LFKGEKRGKKEGVTFSIWGKSRGAISEGPHLVEVKKKSAAERKGEEEKKRKIQNVKTH